MAHPWIAVPSAQSVARHSAFTGLAHTLQSGPSDRTLVPAHIRGGGAALPPPQHRWPSERVGVGDGRAHPPGASPAGKWGGSGRGKRGQAS